MTRITRLLAVGAVLAGGLTAPALAQDPFADEAQEDPVHLTEVTVTPASAKPGDTVVLSAKFAVDAPYHVYGVEPGDGLPTGVTLAEGSGWVTVGELSTDPESHPVADEATGMKYTQLEGEFTLSVPLVLGSDAEPGVREIAGAIQYMACTDEFCLSPAEAEFKVTVTVEAGAAGGDAEPEDGDERRATITRAGFVGPASPGGEALLEIELTIIEKNHVGAQSTAAATRPTFKWDLPKGFIAGALLDHSEPHEIEMWGEKIVVHEGKAVLRQPIEVPADAKLGTVKITGKGTWQVCDDSVCVMQEDVPVSAELEIKPLVTMGALSLVGEAPRGEAAVAEIRMNVAQGWYLVAPGSPGGPTIEWTSEGTLLPGVLEIEGVKKTLGVDGQPLAAYGGEVILRQHFMVDDHAQVGEVNLEATVAWNATDGSAQTSGTSDLEQKISISSPGLTVTLMLTAFVAGLITLVTPCVLPLLPVTVSFFSKQTGPPLPRAMAYASGIIFTITGIGLVFSTTIQAFAQGWVFNLAIGILFIALALSLFGVFTIAMPSWLINKSTEKSASGGVTGSFFMAATLALTSFSCSAPFIAVLFSDFDQGQYGSALALLLIYSGTMAAPFFVCSLFPSMLRAMPSAGSWMDAVKITMGFVEFALAFKFLRTVFQNFEIDVLPRSFVLAIWVACSLLAAIYLFGWIAIGYGEKPKSIGVGRMMWGLLFLTLALYMLPGVFGHRLATYIDAFILTNDSEITQGRVGGGVPSNPTLLASDDVDTPVPFKAASSHGFEWPTDDWDGALARAKLRNTLAVFDFTGVG